MEWLKENWFRVGILVLLAIITGSVIYHFNFSPQTYQTKSALSITSGSTTETQISTSSSTPTVDSSSNQTKNVTATVKKPSNNNSGYSPAALASAKKDCATAAAQWEQTVTMSGPGSQNYQSFFNPSTSSCYIRTYAAGTFDVFPQTMVMLSFHDVYSNTLLASCVAKMSSDMPDSAWGCNTGDGTDITMAQFNRLIDYYAGQ